MPFSTQEDDQGKGAKALDDEPEGGDRMSASQREELWVCTRLSGEHAITTNTEVAEAWERAGWRKDGPWVRAEHHVPAEQLRVAVEALDLAKGTLLRVAQGCQEPAFGAAICLKALGVDADTILGESQEEMKP